MCFTRNGLNPKIMNVLAKQQAELAKKAPDGKFNEIRVFAKNGKNRIGYIRKFENL